MVGQIAKEATRLSIFFYLSFKLSVVSTWKDEIHITFYLFLYFQIKFSLFVKNIEIENRKAIVQEMEIDLAIKQATRHGLRSYLNSIWTRDVTSLKVFVSCSQVDLVSDPSLQQIEPAVHKHKQVTKK